MELMPNERRYSQLYNTFMLTAFATHIAAS